MLIIYKLLANIKQLRPLKHSWNKRKCANIIFRERLSRNSRENWISSKLSWWWTNTWAKIGSTAYKARKRRRSQQRLVLWTVSVALYQVIRVTLLFSWWNAAQLVRLDLCPQNGFYQYTSFCFVSSFLVCVLASVCIKK